MDTNNLRNY